MNRNDATVRIGMVAYINTAPIHTIWRERHYPAEWQMIEDHPAALNEQLAAGDIDLGFCSSHEYGIRPDRYRILGDLSISANGPVGSVFLFSRVKPEKLAGETVLLSAQSKTSVCLVRIVLEKFYRVQPVYCCGEVASARQLGAKGILAIGDDALRLKLEGSYQYCIDLGEAWQQETGLPFVFAVCAVRDEFCRTQPELVARVHRALVDCRDEGLRQLDRICRLAAPRIPMEVDSCHSYLQAIHYDLDEAKQRALATFYRALVDFGEASEAALPLKIHPLHHDIRGAFDE
ncbi:MAG: menaquinone biosynthesis protein [Desulfobulbaceae bacterium]|nr:menaquinone biosynthesis protein [Desulfobulbaceae bacterium]